MYKILFVLLAVPALAVACIRSGGEDENEEHEKTSVVKKGDALPEFTVADKDGNTAGSADLAGKGSLIFFFETGCPDCQKVFPVINELYQLVAGDGRFALLSITRAQAASVVDEYFGEQGYSIPYYLDPVRETYGKFATGYIPRLYIAGPDGVITWMAVEKLPADTNTATQLLALMESALD